MGAHPRLAAADLRFYHAFSADRLMIDGDPVEVVYTLRSRWYRMAMDPRTQRRAMASGPEMTAAERAKLEQRRDRLMKLMKEGDGAGGELDAEDRADLAEEWSKIDRLLQGSR